MKYLKYFSTEAEYNTYIQSDDFVLPNVSYAVDTDSVFYHVIKTETGDYKILLLKKKNISGLTYNMVDLGLPSGLLWADRNIGASTPEEIGTVFAWGETIGYTVSVEYCTAAELCLYFQPMIGDEPELTPDNIDEFLSSPEWGMTDKDMTTTGAIIVTDICFSGDWSDYFDTTDYGETFNKYTTNKLTVLQSEDDAATVNMGSEYRMPTLADIEELINNCTVTFIDRDGNEFSQSQTKGGSIEDYNLKGIKFTGSNSNNIFIPASGYCADYVFECVYEDGFLWSSSLRSDDFMDGHCLHFMSNGRLYSSSYPRYHGVAVRGVK